MLSNKHSPAFTIVELLIVIVVIAILASISVIAFNGVQRSAAIATLQSELRQASTKLELARIDADGGIYPASLADIGITDTQAVQFQYTRDEVNKTFCITAATVTDQNVSPYRISNTDKEPVEGLCAGHINPHSPPSYEVTDVGAGYYGSCAVVGGRAYCWGNNDYGQLGNGSTASSSTPVLVDATGVLAGKTVTSIDMGYHHACAVADGEAYCWGRNNFYQLGNRSNANSLVPVKVYADGELAGKTVTAISLNYSSNCVIADGQAYCWGYNANGALGVGNTNTQWEPKPVYADSGLAGKTVTDIAVGSGRACAVASGSLFCWGDNSSGQLGDGTTNNSSIPVQITGGDIAGKTVTSVSVSGSLYSYKHACAVAGGGAYCWGSQVPLGSYTSSSLVPVQVYADGELANKTVTDVSVGQRFSCAIADNDVYCWGTPNRALGINIPNTSAKAVPTAVLNSGVFANNSVTDLTTGDEHACVVAAAEAYCWGVNDKGEVGVDISAYPVAPVPVAVSPWPQP